MDIMASIMKKQPHEKKSPDRENSEKKKTSNSVNLLEQSSNQGLRMDMAIENIDAALPRDILALQQNNGNHAVTGLIQAKLKIGPVGDSYEQEADRMADRVMSSESVLTPSVQGHRDNSPIQRQNPGDEEELLQGKAQNRAGLSLDASSDVEGRIRNMRGGGSELPNGVRAFMEARFNKDFSKVHIHTDGEAARLNQDLRARAFTQENDVYFNSGEYQPGADAGKRLIAHELTHVIQQTGGGSNAIQRKEIWEDLGKTKVDWDALTPTQKNAAIKAGQVNTAVRGEYGIETAGSWAGGNIANSLFGAANLGTGIAQTVEGDNSTTATSGASIAVTGLQTLATGVAFAGSAAQFHRGRMMRNRGTQAGRMLGNRYMRRSAWSMSQQAMGIGSGIAGITSTGINMAGDNTGSNMAGGVSSLFSGIGSGLGLAQGSISMHSARMRSNKASAMAANTASSDELKAIATQTSQSQGKASKGMGIFGNIMGGASSVLGMTKGFGNIMGSTGQVLGGIGVGLGFLGTAAGAIGGLVSYVSKKKQENQLKKLQAQSAALTAEIGTLDGKITTAKASLDAINNTDLPKATKELDAIDKQITKVDADITAAQDQAAKKPLEAQKKTLEGEKKAKDAEIAALKQRVKDLTAEISTLDGQKKTKETELKTVQNQILAYDPAAAADKLVQNIVANPDAPADPRMVTFLEDVLGITPAVEIVLRDPEAAKQLIMEKMNKNG
jgi:hypothetical protein